jgi:protein-tyrosine-phosphatase
MMTLNDGSPVLFDYPNPRLNAFIMMRFQTNPQQQAILESLRESLEYYGVKGLRADDKSYASSLWANVKSYMDACNLGIAVFEQMDDVDFNPNVSLELGYMIAQGKPVLILKEKQLKTLPTDVVGQLYRTFDSFNIQSTVRQSVLEWLRDVGIAKSPAERLLLFVSYGGTCRCAMAKIALERALANRRLTYPLRIMSVAHSRAVGGADEASHGARRAIFNAYGVDYLKDHRVTRRNPGLAEDADLILTMNDKYKVGFSESKTFNFNSFFGLEGDVPNPWPDDPTEEAYQRYRDCLKHLRSVLENGTERILEYLDQTRY